MSLHGFCSVSKMVNRPLLRSIAAPLRRSWRTLLGRETGLLDGDKKRPRSSLSL
ncbi:conserved hypothetical protein [delta proteobacterium NaphS2]|nr:conserved hypothetical protein [delta proteobacterium NaphS2]